MTQRLKKSAYLTIILSNNLGELTNKTAYNRDDGSYSCIDVICTYQPIFTKTGVLASLGTHSKHQTIHGNLNVNILCQLPYKRNIYQYKSANINTIHRDIKTGIL